MIHHRRNPHQAQPRQTPTADGRGRDADNSKGHNNVDKNSNNNNKNGNKNDSNRRRRRKNSPNPVAYLIQTFLEEDLMITLIQVISAIILIVCALLLLSKWVLGTDTIGDALLDIYQSLSLVSRGIQPGRRYPRKKLKPSSIYTIPDSMNHIGDKSDHYATLRKEYDAMELPRIEPKYHFTTMPMVDETEDGSNSQPYDIYNCPEEPPDNYPFSWKLMTLLTAWPADDTDVRSQVHQGLCVFDYQTDFEKALTYREAELPFVIRNDPAVQAAVDRWNVPDYMNRMLGPSVKHRAEYSKNNHFLYWNVPPKKRRQQQVPSPERAAQANREHLFPHNNQRKDKPARPWQQRIEVPTDWTEPTEMLRITYSEWLSHANVTDESQLGPDQPHWYFRLIGCGETGPEGQCDAGSSEYLFDELTFFQPKKSLYIVEPDQQKGIHCRFGMKGVIAENHFDGSRNMIAVLGGERRYILSHPDQCPYLSLLPKGHPSARHSAVDWSDPDLELYPEFDLARGNEVVMQAGDVLYLPTNWFHYIISLDLNFQCNTRSGITQHYMPPIRECGF